MKITSAEFVTGLRGEAPILYEKKPQYAFIGRSNVGKSSLINCLLDRKSLVKTSSTAGKTKEINFFLVNYKMYFVDLPGYGFSHSTIEEEAAFSQLIQWYFMEPVFKRKAVLIVDARIKPSNFDLEMYRILKENEVETIVVANKIDGVNQKEKHANMKALTQAFPDTTIIPCSAKEKIGREEIWKKLLE
jgi:GTP-binding protein